MSWLKKIKDRYTHRRAAKGDHDPWWVTLMLDVGRPLVAVLILIMCAPGEHYLAMEAGWSEILAWGMPGTLTAYAGIAAVVATKRAKEAPGRKTAISGAVISIALAMAAQPIAHLYGRHGLNPQQIALTVAAGLIPAAVFGHLLHMGAASPKPVPVVEETAPEPEPESDSLPPWVSEELTRRKDTPSRGDVLDELMSKDSGHAVPVSDFLSARAVRPGLGLSEYVSELTYGQPDTPGQPDVSEADSPGTAGQDTSDTHGQDITPDTRTEEPAPVVSVVRPVPSNVRQIKTTLSADVRAYLSENPGASDEDLAAAMAVKWPKAKWDSVRKARDRYQEKQEKTS